MSATRDLLLSLEIAGADADDALSGRQTEATAHAAAFAKSPERRVLLLSGDTGTGKSIAAIRWLANLPDYGKASDTPEGWEWLRSRMAYVRAPDLSRLNLQYRDEDRREFDRLRLVRWLVIDDLGTESAAASVHVEDLIDFRCRSAWTVLSTNVPCGPKFDASPFSQRYGARVVSRILGNGWVRGCGAVDLRRGAP